MFSARKAVESLDDVPVEWVFENYLNLSEKLTGQNVKFKSVFNLSDSNPSMYVYYCRLSKQYKFKCFSTGIQGGHVDLVQILHSITPREACLKIIDDYKVFIKTGDYRRASLVIEPRWIVDSWIPREWNKDDVAFWSPYNIGSSLLDKYQVKPLRSYTMYKEGIESFEKQGKRLYGYFTGKGELYKIYQPESDLKFLTLKKYIQGWDQLSGKSRLFICSSLKDIMSLESLKIDADFIAPPSENTSLELIMDFIKGYAQKYVVFDNDPTGLNMMQKYELEYGIPYIHIPLSKDVSDSIRDHGASKVKSYIKTLIEA
jgi:hypothetical protein